MLNFIVQPGGIANLNGPYNVEDDGPHGLGVFGENGKVPIIVQKDENEGQRGYVNCRHSVLPFDCKLRCIACTQCLFPPYDTRQVPGFVQADPEKLRLARTPGIIFNNSDFIKMAHGYCYDFRRFCLLKNKATFGQGWLLPRSVSNFVAYFLCSSDKYLWRKVIAERAKRLQILTKSIAK